MKQRIHQTFSLTGPVAVQYSQRSHVDEQRAIEHGRRQIGLETMHRRSKPLHSGVVTNRRFERRLSYG